MRLRVQTAVFQPYSCSGEWREGEEPGACNGSLWVLEMLAGGFA